MVHRGPLPAELRKKEQMIGAVIGSILLIAGGVIVIAAALKWKANLLETQLLSTAAVLLGFALLPDRVGGEAVKIAAVILILVTAGSFVQKAWYFRGRSASLWTGLIVLPLSAIGLWLIWH